MTYPQLHQQELIELAEIAGISAAPRVFRILLDLLALPASPEDIYTLLKTLSQSPSRRISDERTHVFASPVKK
ncbi:PREDICTED: mitotic-spindle organizing protein 2-like [Dinoponera quadriceps]|uniref:Mitotic-spindle organizing protein 2-like n=1 Tax=Dinoponera quadriceps TaxID=609295 RepID=A0A6P3YE31_DINQU|nr:PREDICTED: mitotic-spindle organizing protein 2-like [Dinoponera quadriceps]